MTTASAPIQTDIPAAPAATTPAAAPAVTAVPTPADWTSSLNDDMKSYVQTKGFKDPAMALDSYRNLEKLMGAPKERLVKLPEKADDPAWGEIYDRLGRPKDAKEYSLKVPEGMTADEKFSEWARTNFHELGLTKKQAEGLFTKYNERMASEMTGITQEYQTSLANQEVALKKEWGMAYDQNMAGAKLAAKEFGLTGATIDALEKQMGYDGVMKFMHKIGSKIGEQSFTTGDNPARGFNGALTPAAAMAQIGALRQDPDFVRRYTAGDATAKAEMNRLHQFAYPEQA